MGVLLTDGVLLSLENTSIITFISLQVLKQQHNIQSKSIVSGMHMTLIFCHCTANDNASKIVYS